MALLKQWRDMAYSETANKGDLQRLWSVLPVSVYLVTRGVSDT